MHKIIETTYIYAVAIDDSRPKNNPAICYI